MTRTNITHSETGEFAGWFDRSTSLEFEEDRWWDGHNHISRATGSQWNHETLHYTKAGNWVLEHTSQWQGTQDTCHAITEQAAITWLLAQRCENDDNIDKLPESVRKALRQAVAAAEL